MVFTSRDRDRWWLCRVTSCSEGFPVAAPYCQHDRQVGVISIIEFYAR